MARRRARIAYIDPQSYHGLAKYDIGYLRGLRDARFDGDVVFYCSTLFEGSVPERVALRPIFDYNRKRSPLRKAASYLRSMLRLTLDAFSAPADLYHFQWFKLPAVDYLFVLALRRLAGASVMMTAHNVVPHGGEGKRHRALGRIYRTVDRIVVHNASTADEIASRFGVEKARISVLRHGPLKINGRGRARHRSRIRRFAAEHDPCFLFIGRGSRYKGLDLLLDAWARCAAAGHDRAGLVVIGAVDRDLKQRAARAAKELDSLLVIDEYAAEGDLYHALRCANVVVLPHRRISQSGVLLAALGRRVPVLVASLPGLVEPLELGDVGWRFDGTVEGLAERLGDLAAHPERIAAARGNDAAWKAVAEAYAWRNIGYGARDMYRRLLRQAGEAARGAGTQE